MKRLFTEKLIHWKNKPNRKPLIIRGARQIGKSYTIVDFGKNYFTGTTHIINFEKNPEFCTIFNGNFDIYRIISEIELINNRRINPGEDLLFFDEVQECPNAILSLRYFYEQLPDLHVISAGSLLEFSLKDLSFPVGRVQIMNMHPMNFAEYLLANDKELLMEAIMDPRKKQSDIVQNILRQELKNYFIVGGMPECLKAYTQNHRLIDVFEIQNDLINTFRQDFSKYSGHSDKHCLNQVLNSVAQNIGFQIKYASLADDYSNPTIKKAFHLLETARLFKKVYATSPDGLPLGASINEKTFKAIMLDIGLLSRMNGFSSSIPVVQNDLKTIFRGSMAEQFVGQELISAGHEDLHYWVRQAKSSTAEVDFILEQDAEIVPVEVKSGSSGTLKSMHILLNNYPNIMKGIVLSDAHSGILPEQKLEFLPLYYAYSLKRHSII